MISQTELGFFGNIWVRQNVLANAGDVFSGHKHYFDHVTLLVSGTIEMEVDGYPPKQFVGPTFIVIKKEYAHKVTAITDNAIFYCVFALRDINGEVMDDIYSGQHDPRCACVDAEAERAELQKLSDLTQDFGEVNKK